MSIGRDKSVLEFRLLKGMTYRQIGELLGISQERVRQIVKRCYRVFCWSLERQEKLLNIKNVPLEKPKENLVTLDDLSIRSRNALLSANIKEFEDLAKFREKDILSLRNIGKKGLTEITNLMKLRGISFR